MEYLIAAKTELLQCFQTWMNFRNVTGSLKLGHHIFYNLILFSWSFLSILAGKISACNVRHPGLIPESGSSPEQGNGNPLQYSCLGNSMDRGAWWATVHGVTKGQTWLRDYAQGQDSFYNVKSVSFNYVTQCCCCCLVAKSCLMLCNPMNCSPPGSSVHELSQARILELVVISFSRWSSQPRNQIHISWIADGFFTTEPPGKPCGHK